MSTTTRLALPHIAAAQAQKHVTHNEALEILDALVHLTLESRALASPPSSPSDGARYLVPAGAAGAWAGRADAIAVFDRGAWTFHLPRPGWRAFVRDEAQLLVYDGTAWSPLVRRAARFGVNADPVGANRLAVSSAAALFTHEGGDVRLAVNKAASGDVASIQFQRGFATQAEIGLAGDDDLRVKVRDGASLRQALVVKAGTGHLGIGIAEPSAELEVADSSGDGDCRIQLRADATEVAQLGVSSTQVFLDTVGTKPFIVYVNGEARAIFDPLKLDVMSPLKVRSYTLAALPAASTAGAGAITFVSNESGGPVLAFSDGVAWRRVTDRAVVS